VEKIRLRKDELPCPPQGSAPDENLGREGDRESPERLARLTTHDVCPGCRAVRSRRLAWDRAGIDLGSASDPRVLGTRGVALTARLNDCPTVRLTD
jgi:hypothetical protein